MTRPPPSEWGGTRPPKAETRRRVLEAAFTVFGEQGIAGSSLSTVAKRADLTKGAVYSSFESKNDLIVAMLEEYTLDTVESASKAVEAAHDSDDALRALASSMASGTRDNGSRRRLIAELFVMSHTDPELAEVLRDHRRQARERGAEAIRSTCEQFGITPRLPPEELVVVIFALSNGFAIEGGIDAGATSAELLTRVLMALVV